MPRYDATGPFREGSRTGRGFGPCGYGLGWRRRFNMGSGDFRHLGWGWFGSREEQLRALQDYKQTLREELEDVERAEKELASKK